MGKFIDLTEQRFEKLLVLYRDYDYEKEHKGTYWRCLCDCGNETTVNAARLKSGKTKSCGCLRIEVLTEKGRKTKLEKEKRIQERKEKYDLTNKRFGKWLVLNRDWSKKDNKDSYWICKCDCGTIKSVIGQSLRNGNSTSCGCSFSDNFRYDLYKDRTGEIYNELTVLELDTNYKKEHNLKDNHSYWKVRCSCGNVFTICSSRLGVVFSCGCIKSKGEYLIHKFLNQYKINYQSQYTFSDLKSSKNKLLRFDFAIFNNENKLLFLLEFNGIQHYQISKGTYWDTEENLESLQERDKLKEEYCKKNNIPLEIIKYSQIDNIEYNIKKLCQKYNLNKGE